jgi:hypothetical protein
LQLGVIKVVTGENGNVLIARGLDGVYEIGWNDLPPENLSQIVEELDALLEELLENAEAPEDGTPSATPDPNVTPEVTPTIEETPEE